jgi:hypothetical protein
MFGALARPAGRTSRGGKPLGWCGRKRSGDNIWGGVEGAVISYIFVRYSVGYTNVLVLFLIDRTPGTASPALACPGGCRCPSQAARCPVRKAGGVRWRVPRVARRTALEGALPRALCKIAFEFPSMLPLLSSPLVYLFSSLLVGVHLLCLTVENAIDCPTRGKRVTAVLTEMVANHVSTDRTRPVWR